MSRPQRLRLWSSSYTIVPLAWSEQPLELVLFASRMNRVEPVVALWSG